MTHCHDAAGQENKCSEVARKQNNVQQDTEEIAHWLCKSATLGASQTKSIKPDAKLVLLMLDRKL